MRERTLIIPSPFDVKILLLGQASSPFGPWEVVCSLLLFYLEELLALSRSFFLAQSALNVTYLPAHISIWLFANLLPTKEEGISRRASYFQLQLYSTPSCLSTAFWVPREVILFTSAV